MPSPQPVLPAPPLLSPYLMAPFPGHVGQAERSKAAPLLPALHKQELAQSRPISSDLTLTKAFL